MNKLYIIYNQNIAAKLLLLGYKLVKIEKNKNNERLTVFFFNESNKLINEVEKIKNNQS